MKKVKKATQPKNKHPLLIPLLFMVLLALATIFALNHTNRQQNLFGRAQTLTNCDVPASELAMTASEQQLLQLVNAYRAQNGAPALVSSPQLKRAAEWLSNHMATGGPFSHNDGLGRAFNVRLMQCGFTGKTSSENIAWNSTANSAQRTFDQWKNSPGHNKNMLNAQYMQVGIAEKVAANGRHYWTFNAAAGTPNGVVPTSKPEPTAVPVPPTQKPTSAPLPTQAPIQPTQAPQDPQPTSKPIEDPTPTFGCLGACPTPKPTEDPPAQDPIDGPIIDPVTDEPDKPATPPTGGNNPPATGEANQGLIALILQLILQILRLLF